MFLTNQIKRKIRQYLTRKLGVPEIPTALERLAENGFQPKQIFDVGAYQGDFAQLCFQHFPMVKVACFEVLEHKVKELNSLASEHQNMQIFPTLLGASIQENVSFNQAETASSVLVEKVPQNFAVKSYPMTTIDQIVQQHYDGKSPQFLKIDVQGYELEVLKGAEQRQFKDEMQHLEIFA
ncbi:MAG: FkbM family methyltransferase [Pseudanabaena sp. ELA607]